MGETRLSSDFHDSKRPFSILKRIVMGETSHSLAPFISRNAFSILKRIVMGETGMVLFCGVNTTVFQYPQADRDG